MQLLETGEQPAVVSISLDELKLLAGCINEALEMVDDWEFSSRVGFDRSEAIALREEIDRTVLEISRGTTTN